MQMHGQKEKHYNYNGQHLKIDLLLAPPIMPPEFRDHIQEQNNPSTPAGPKPSYPPHAEEMSQYQDL